jgi:phospholipid transport system substrate-binding protein
MDRQSSVASAVEVTTRRTGCRARVLALAASLMLATFLPRTARAGETPAQIIQDAINHALKILRDPALQGAAKRPQRHAQLRALADQVFDWQDMAQRCLGFYWRRITPNQQAEFLKVFEELLATYYLNQIDNFQGTEKIDMLGSRKTESQVEVRTVLTTASHERIPIDYFMKEEPRGWRVFDLSIEGVSLVGNYRDRFSRFLVNQTFDQLLQVLKAQQ